MATRSKIAEAFGFIKVRPTHVVNNEIADDGFNVKDIEAAITVEKLQHFLQSLESDLDKLFDLLVDTLEGRMPENTIDMSQIIAKPVELTKQKNVKTKKSK